MVIYTKLKHPKFHVVVDEPLDWWCKSKLHGLAVKGGKDSDS